MPQNQGGLSPMASQCLHYTPYSQWPLGIHTKTFYAALISYRHRESEGTGRINVDTTCAFSVFNMQATQAAGLFGNRISASLLRGL